MTDLRAFEIRLASALDAYADDVDGRVDAVEVTARASLARRRPWDRLRLPIPVAMPRLAPALVLVLLLALLAGVVWVGASLLAPHRLLGLAPSGIELVAVEGWSSTGAAAATDGSVWLAQGGRLERVAPNGTVTTWDVGDDLRFGGSLASSIAPARAGGIWLIGPAGLQRFDGTGFEAPIPAPPGVSIGRLAEGPDGSLWVSGNEHGLFRRSGSGWEALPLPSPGLTAWAIAVDDRGRPWVGLQSASNQAAMGVAVFDAGSWTTYVYHDAAPLVGTVGSIVQAPDGAVWVGTSAGVAVLRDGAWSASRVEDWSEASYDVAVGPDGTVWAGATYGPARVAVYRDGAWRVYPDLVSLPAEGAAAVYVLPTDGGVSAAWFSSTGRGLLRLVDDRWTAVGGLDGRPLVSGVQRLVGGAGSDAWALDGPRADVIGPWHLQSTAVGREAIPAAGASVEVRDLAIAPDGTAWAATSAGLAARVDGTWTIADPTPATAVTVALDGRVWAAGSTRVWTLTRDGTGWTAATVGALPVNPQVGALRRIAVDGHGALWAAPEVVWGGTPGLYRLSGGGWERVDIVPGVDTVTLNLETAPNGDLWATIDDYGGPNECCIPSPAALVARFDGSRWTTYGSAEGIPAPDLDGPGIAIAADGTVWLASDGLTSFDGTTWSRSLEGVTLRAVAVSGDGTIWAAGDVGMVRVASDSVARQGR